ncbi:uncharacterized protein AB675_11885 [Cyphellophora attinorum]|uniref:Uncharacterized protein n=1 Tax=Cyphellophora attinorum TaxID=1664694 RepID=A0A0N1NY89_9EURO|nr:uncharacterized protein AB675_11885 [Phialophora attinorum]KPI36744.1 hypothetical protein AB675_11885 [Phialophora attinorum]
MSYWMTTPATPAAIHQVMEGGLFPPPTNSPASLSEPEAAGALVNLSNPTPPQPTTRDSTIDLFTTLPPEIRHMIYAFLFPEVAHQHSPYNISITRDREWWRSAISPRTRLDLPEYIVTGERRDNGMRQNYGSLTLAGLLQNFRSNARNEHSLAWLQPLMNVSLVSRLLRVEVALWLYPKLKFNFDHSADAFEIFGHSSQVILGSVRSISFHRNTSGCRCHLCRESRQWWKSKDVTRLAALLPGLEVLELAMPVNWTSARPPKIKDLRVVQSILDDHPNLRKATGRSLKCSESDAVHAAMGKVRLLSERAFAETSHPALDVRKILRRYDDDVRKRKAAKAEQSEERRKKREEFKKKREAAEEQGRKEHWRRWPLPTGFTNPTTVCIQDQAPAIGSPEMTQSPEPVSPSLAIGVKLDKEYRPPVTRSQCRAQNRQ